MPPELLYELVRFISVKQNVSAVLHSSRKLQHYLIPLLIKRKEAALMEEYNTLVSLYQSFRDNSDMYRAISVLGEDCVYATKLFHQMRHISAQYDAARRPPPQQAGASGSAEMAAAPPAIVGGVAAAPAIVGGVAAAPAIVGGVAAAPAIVGGVAAAPAIVGGVAAAPAIVGGVAAAPAIVGGVAAAPAIVGGIAAAPAIVGGVAATPAIVGGQSARQCIAFHRQFTVHHGGAVWRAQFRALLAYFEDARRAHENRQKCGTKSTESGCSKKTETELQQLKRQLGSLGELFDQFLDTSLAMRERTQRVEDELERRFRRLELENSQLKAQLDAMQRMHNSSTAQGDNRTNGNFGGTEHFAGAEPTMAPINLATISSTDEVVQQQQADNADTNVDGGDSELVRFVAQLPPLDESGQLMLNKFKYSCQFAQLLYTGGCHVESVFCNIFSEYPATFFEELVEYALTTQRPDAMVRRICIWLAADEPWPDMATLFPSAAQRDISTDRVLYEFHNIGQSCGQQQRKHVEPHVQSGAGDSTNLSISELVTQTAAQVVQEQQNDQFAAYGFHWCDEWGAFYSADTGYFYDPNSALFFHPNTQLYYVYNTEAGTYDEVGANNAQIPLVKWTKKAFRRRANRIFGDDFVQTARQEDVDVAELTLDLVDRCSFLAGDYCDKRLMKRSLLTEETMEELGEGVSIKRQFSAAAAAARCSTNSESESEDDGLRTLKEEIVRRQQEEEICRNAPCIRMVERPRGLLHIVTICGARVGFGATMDVQIGGGKDDESEQFDKEEVQLLSISYLDGQYRMEWDSRATAAEGCEPGLFTARGSDNGEEKSKKRFSRRAEHRRQMRALKEQYGLLEEDDALDELRHKYSDRAARRRREFGIDLPAAVSNSAVGGIYANCTATPQPGSSTDSVQLQQARKKGQRFAGGAAVVVPINAQNKGFQLLKGMGWTEGQGLGKTVRASRDRNAIPQFPVAHFLLLRLRCCCCRLRQICWVQPSTKKQHHHFLPSSPASSIVVRFAQQMGSITQLTSVQQKCGLHTDVPPPTPTAVPAAPLTLEPLVGSDTGILVARISVPSTRNAFSRALAQAVSIKRQFSAAAAAARCSTNSESESEDDGLRTLKEEIVRRQQEEEICRNAPCIRMVERPRGLLHIVTICGARVGFGATMDVQIGGGKDDESEQFDKEEVRRALAKWVQLLSISYLDGQYRMEWDSRATAAEPGSSYSIQHEDLIAIGPPGHRQILLSFHIHNGLNTCQGCEPGLFTARGSDNGEEKSKKRFSRRAEHRRQMRALKEQYGLLEEDDALDELRHKYSDRAARRRREFGIDLPAAVTNSTVGGIYANCTATPQPGSSTDSVQLQQARKKDSDSPAVVPINAQNKGFQLLKGMGWTEGQGLGKNSQGIQGPIVTQFKNDRGGLGTVSTAPQINIRLNERQRNLEQMRKRYEQVGGLGVGSQQERGGDMSLKMMTLMVIKNEVGGLSSSSPLLLLQGLLHSHRRCFPPQQRHSTVSRRPLSSSSSSSSPLLLSSSSNLLGAAVSKKQQHHFLPSLLPPASSSIVIAASFAQQMGSITQLTSVQQKCGLHTDVPPPTPAAVPAAPLTLEPLVGSDTGILVARISVPSTRNAFSRALAQAFRDMVDQLRYGLDTRALILTSAVPQAFCSGVDLKERRKMAANEVFTFVDGLRRTLTDLSELPFPTIASIDGCALGGGLELALACDIRIASPRSELGLPETRLAIIPGCGGTQRLPRVVGVAKAKELILTGKKIRGEEAAHIGLLNHLVDDPFAKALEIARDVLKTGPLANRVAKLAVEQGYDLELRSGLVVEQQCYAQLMPTKDRLEALDAFAQKRPPKFKGE
uniref:G-patch domain-containing protein n=1 Tax=Globodera pallida TaxID=36090 RepID=A0A183BUK2_GLOPA